MLTWLGLPLHSHKDFNPNKIARILIDFAKDVEDTKIKIASDKMKETKRKEKIRRHKSMIMTKTDKNLLFGKFHQRSDEPPNGRKEDAMVNELENFLKRDSLKLRRKSMH